MSKRKYNKKKRKLIKNNFHQTELKPLGDSVVTVPPKNYVKEFQERQLSIKNDRTGYAQLPYIPQRFFDDSGEYEDSVKAFVTPQRTIVIPNEKATLIEIKKEGTAAGAELEEKMLNFFLSIGVPPDDIFPGKKVKHPGGDKEFSDGVILFGNTAFLFQMKHRNVPSNANYQVPDSYDDIKDRISKAKKQYYTSISMAQGFFKGFIALESIKGTEKIIEMDKYNWVPIILINRNYLGNFDRKMEFSSAMSSSKTMGLTKVNHVILSTQGLVSMSRMFLSYIELLSFIKLLSLESRLYELGKEPSLVYNKYGKYGAIDLDESAIIQVLVENVNTKFVNNEITKQEATEVLNSFYSLNGEELKEFFDYFKHLLLSEELPEYTIRKSNFKRIK